MNELCQCDGPGFCDRHMVQKSTRDWQLCKGVGCTKQQCARYWNAWEAGTLPGQAGAPENPEPPQFSRGLGDTVSRFITRTTGIKPCGGCNGRAATLNHWFPSNDLPPVEPLELTEPVRRNCIFHLWPVRHVGAWQWNCDQLIQRAHLFNGRRVVAIAVSHDADEPEVVKEYLRDFTDEFVVMRNKKQLREVVTFVPMLERIQSLNPNEVTWSGHGKCVRHRIGPDIGGSTIFRWTDAMYRTTLDDWPAVREALKTNAMVGSFRRFGEFNIRGNHRWHYSGTFYWFRHVDVFRRNWRYVPKRFFGTEAWPGQLFKPDETACLFADRCGDLYDAAYWDRDIQPALEEWHGIHAKH